MAADEDQPRSGVSRRDALRLLAATTTTVAAGSMIISQPAHAANGSHQCCGFTGSATVSVRMISQTGDRTDGLSVTVSGVNATCPCGAAVDAVRVRLLHHHPEHRQRRHHLDHLQDAVAVGYPPVLWPNDGGSATISVGVRVTCPAGSGVGTVTCCRYATGTFTIGKNQDRTFTFALGSDNGNSPPSGLPPCGVAPLLGAPQLRSAGALTAGGSLSIVNGTGTMPILDPNATDAPPVDLGPVEPAQPNSDATSTTSTTTTTDKPGKGPKPSDSTTTSSTSTTTTSTTTTSTTAPASTTAPPSTATPGG